LTVIVFLIAGPILIFPFIVLNAPAKWMDDIISRGFERKYIAQSVVEGIVIHKNNELIAELQKITDFFMKKYKLEMHHPKIFYIMNDHINASAYPGEIIVINQGLINEVGSMEELLVVLSHEIAHIE